LEDILDNIIHGLTDFSMIVLSYLYYAMKSTEEDDESISENLQAQAYTICYVIIYLLAVISIMILLISWKVFIKEVSLCLLYLDSEVLTKRFQGRNDTREYRNARCKWKRRGKGR